MSVEYPCAGASGGGVDDALKAIHDIGGGKAPAFSARKGGVIVKPGITAEVECAGESVGADIP